MPASNRENTAEPLVLAFDTSSAHVAGAVLRGTQVLDQARIEMAKGQAERLMGFCAELLQRSGVTVGELDLIATGTGPGNFTGIRISVSAARGLALGLGIPAIGVSILEAQAYGLDGPVISTLDGRRGALYFQLLGAPQPYEPLLCDMDTLPELPGAAQATCVGHRAAEIAEEVSGKAVSPVYPTAEAIARCALRNRRTDMPRPAPLYIRPADAAPTRDAAPVILP
ncbi:tRNA (adenosine(37)-N6)-threonylcarbamoyltransferase complex dimerization subunit type 1 TsaB [uncultured Roseobacter sp.]|uniref:tRNA (adenosine(37)-N6)-threonylcarbamoyltransferase complex dimerization subunit type 1 TsaB n=1 Tax=uncultured Roseobacter sp. TaxID=114847 RepID=UPI002637975B|nr:tRNA (adenosine(37)-N6)-threonylcarbamoyltransferase complex dimerization subunit type 1 TsaB [uncultured Roseobacter sp.]